MKGDGSTLRSPSAGRSQKGTMQSSRLVRSSTSRSRSAQSPAAQPAPASAPPLHPDSALGGVPARSSAASDPACE